MKCDKCGVLSDLNLALASVMDTTQLAFDASGKRLWSVCIKCGAWSPHQAAANELVYHELVVRVAAIDSVELHGMTVADAGWGCTLIQVAPEGDPEILAPLLQRDIKQISRKPKEPIWRKVKRYWYTVVLLCLFLYSISRSDAPVDGVLVALSTLLSVVLGIASVVLAFWGMLWLDTKAMRAHALKSIGAALLLGAATAYLMESLLTFALIFGLPFVTRGIYLLAARIRGTRHLKSGATVVSTEHERNAAVLKWEMEPPAISLQIGGQELRGAAAEEMLQQIEKIDHQSDTNARWRDEGRAVLHAAGGVAEILRIMEGRKALTGDWPEFGGLPIVYRTALCLGLRRRVSG